MCESFLTEFERESIVSLVAMIANDGLDTYGFTGRQEAAIHRALEKLAGGADRRPVLR